MKKILTLLVLLFSSSIFAEDIYDFKIGEISVGDSLLDFYSKEEIINFLNYDDRPSNMQYRIVETQIKLAKEFSAYQIYLKPKDNKFIVYGISGIIECIDKDDCNNKFMYIENDLDEFFINKEIIGPITGDHHDDPSGKSKYKIKYYYLDYGIASLYLTVWSDKMNYFNHVAVDILTSEVDDWINNGYGVN